MSRADSAGRPERSYHCPSCHAPGRMQANGLLLAACQVCEAWLLLLADDSGVHAQKCLPGTASDRYSIWCHNVADRLTALAPTTEPRDPRAESYLRGAYPDPRMAFDAAMALGESVPGFLDRADADVNILLTVPPFDLWSTATSELVSYIQAAPPLVVDESR